MKKVLLLGANSDIAEATAKKFATNGYELILAGRSLEKLEILEQDLVIKYGAVVSAVRFDAQDYESHKKFYASLKVIPEITICFFGFLGDQKVAENNWQEAYNILSTNYIGAVSILNIIAEDYERRGAGCIIGISSVAGDRGRKSNYLYGSAKGGFSIYLSGLRNRLSKSHVHVLSVKPGFVATKMTAGLDLPKILTAHPDQVANAIYHAYKKDKNIIYVLFPWRWIMAFIRLIPERVFKKLNL